MSNPANSNERFKEFYHGLEAKLPEAAQALISHRRTSRRQRGLPRWERKEKQGQDKPLVRVGFVGAGGYAQHHLQVLNALNQVEVSSILTTGNPRVQAVVSRYGIKKTYTDAEKFVADQDIDCFIIAAAAKFLKSLAMQCLATGRPVLMEKPPGVIPGDTKELTEQADRHQTFGLVGMNRRFFSVIEHGLAELARCGPIRGALLEVPEAITKGRQSGPQSKWDYDHYYVRNSIHGIDLLRYIMGDPVEVTSEIWSNHEYGNAAASYASILQYGNGVMATVTALWDTPNLMRLKIVAEHGWVEFDPLTAAASGWYFSRRGLKTPIPIDPVDVEFRSGLYAQDLYFIEAVRRGRNSGFPLPGCTLEDAYGTMRLMQRINAPMMPP